MLEVQIYYEAVSGWDDALILSFLCPVHITKDHIHWWLSSVYEIASVRFSDKNGLASRVERRKTSSVRELEKVKQLITPWYINHEQWIRLNFLGHTAASRCEGFPTLHDVNPSPSSGCPWGLGSKRRQTLPEYISLNSVFRKLQDWCHEKRSYDSGTWGSCYCYFCTFCSFYCYSHLRDSNIRDWHYKPIYLPSPIY